MNPYNSQQPSFEIMTSDGIIQTAQIIGESRIEITKFGKFQVTEKILEDGTLNVWVKEIK